MIKSSSFKFVVLASLFVSSAAMAAATGSVNLGGSVATTLTVTSTATAGASALDLSGGQKIVKVSDIDMSTNNEQGLTLTASSGSLTKTGGTAITFQVTSVADAAVAPVAAGFTIATGTDYTVGTTAAGSSAKDLYIMYTPATLQDPGSYAGSISLTVADNA